MISYLQARERIVELAAQFRLSTETIPLDRAMGRYLASDLLSRENAPSFTNSAMDGFAVHCGDAIELARSVEGFLAAGTNPEQLNISARPGYCVEIMTGAVMPLEYDAVVKVEDVEVTRDASGNAKSIRLCKSVSKGENVRPSGTDFSEGQIIAHRGAIITPSVVMACATVGITQIEVFKKPRVVVISTGDEIEDHSASRLSMGKIRNSTAPFLQAVLTASGCQVEYYGIVPDEPARFFEAIKRAVAEETDIIVSTGAVSMGKYDFVTSVLADLGAETVFHKTAIRPGKPICVARISKPEGYTMFFGAPGNPVSTAVAAKFFMEPFLRRITGSACAPSYFARLKTDAKKPAGLRCFYKARFEINDQGLAEVRVLSGQSSYMVSSLVEANAWAILPEDDSQTIKAGALVEVII